MDGLLESKGEDPIELKYYSHCILFLKVRIGCSCCLPFNCVIVEFFKFNPYHNVLVAQSSNISSF